VNPLSLNVNVLGRLSTVVDPKGSKKLASGPGNLLYSPVKGLLVDPGRLSVPADLPYELQRSVFEFLMRRQAMAGLPEFSYVPAHEEIPGVGLQFVQPCNGTIS